MKSKLVYLVKHNPLAKTVFILLGNFFFKIWGFFIKTQEDLILFVPNTGQTYSGSPREIFQYIQSSEEYKDYKTVWAFNHPEEFGYLETEIVKFESLNYFKVALQAKYWVTDINVERGLKFKKKETVFLNTWHGVALKKIGNDDPNSARYDYSDINYLCVSSDYDKKVFCSALNANSESFLEVGMPRNDRLFRATENERVAIKQRLGIPLDKKVILYAPTWRDSLDKGKTFELNIPLDFTKWEEYLGQDFVFLFRAHSRTTDLLNLTFNDFVLDYSAYPELNDLLIVADLLITDYSSIVIDYAILEKPALCYAYDYENYLSERGFYVDLKEFFSGIFFQMEDQLLDEIKSGRYEESSRVIKKIKDKYMTYSQANATALCVKKLLSR